MDNINKAKQALALIKDVNETLDNQHLAAQIMSEYDGA